MFYLTKPFWEGINMQFKLLHENLWSFFIFPIFENGYNQIKLWQKDFLKLMIFQRRRNTDNFS